MVKTQLRLVHLTDEELEKSEDPTYSRRGEL